MSQPHSLFTLQFSSIKTNSPNTNMENQHELIFFKTNVNFIKVQSTNSQENFDSAICKRDSTYEIKRLKRNRIKVYKNIQLT